MSQEIELRSGAGRAPAAKRGKDSKGFLLGVVYGLVPHTFCILFIVLSVVGATAATSVVKRFMYLPYLFQIIVALSVVFATASSVLYLKRNGILSLPGARFKWKYLSVMYGTTIGINLLFFLVVFPILANVDFTRGAAQAASISASVQQLSGVPSQAPAGAGPQMSLTLRVAIPCPGHAPLIMDELKKVAGITAIKYGYPNSFRVTYDPSQCDQGRILALEVFQQFKATVGR